MTWCHRRQTPDRSILSFLAFIEYAVLMATLTRANSAASQPKDFVEIARQRLDDGSDLELRAGEDVFPLQGETAQAVLTVLSALTSGRHLDITTLPDVLTTGQAAEVLGVSRPTVVALVDSGEILASRIGTHRRIETVHLLAHIERRHQASEAAMDELVRVSEDLGLYDE